MNKAVSTRAVDTSQGSPLVDPKKIRLTSLAPGEQQISLNLSDGTSVQPHLLRSGDEAEQHPVRIPSHDHYWIKASDHSVAKRKWLKTLGQALASHLSIVRGRDKFILSDFPKGYQLFYHVKNSVQTAYLFGYPTKSKVILKFRTAADFVPHLIWLASSHDGRKKCACKYCQRRSDVVVEENKALDTVLAGSHSSERERRKQQTTDEPQEITGIPYDPHEPEITSNYRALELVWCEVDTKEAKIRLDAKYWPGICQTTQVAYEACEVLDLSSTREDRPNSPAQKIQQKKKEVSSNAWKAKKEVHMKHYWTIQLLGLSDLVVRSESQILPWLYRPFEELTWRVVSTGRLPTPDYILNPTKPMPTLASLSNPVIGRLHFQLAIQIGAEIEERWALASDSKGLPESILKKTFPSVGFEAKSAWLGAEKICTQDLVRLKFLERPADPSVDVVSLDPPGKQVLFLHISLFWKKPHSDVTIAVGRLFELVPQKLQHKSSNQTTAARELRNGWLVQYADQVPKGINLTTLHLDQLPAAPKGFQFVPITPDRSLHHLDISCIAGRYYSPKVDHDRLARLRYHFATRNDPSSPAFKMNPSTLKNLASLLGVKSGQNNFMRFSKFTKATREQMLFEASRKSKKMMSSHFRHAKRPAKSHQSNTLN
ncbi:hypothetical protein PCANC_13944 [Puccinia coronata f. sp. avenae]|uniref:Cryptic loci regulator 2 N-terminal domain-containing protein n=1 Tax=Puccinia coronata f. sp. avenae TaxID=200324 RepID=A0A2N5UGE2_9BASI|nr:hypothetical protein PCANC_13944 [Puccinia coronata f. sp. avenae]